MNVSMKDIADKLDISQSTVSLALKNSPRISETTKEKVRHAALMAARRHGKNPQKPPVFAVVSAGRPSAIEPARTCNRIAPGGKRPQLLHA
ncbi:MAG TPA: LacI family DNA-binding transcriptional regulator [Oceanipulchritudo sp.]|nr:LacI family DNA-binding transcriptional regulator [Oceanipulchritudo sp.]